MAAGKVCYSPGTCAVTPFSPIEDEKTEVVEPRSLSFHVPHHHMFLAIFDCSMGSSTGWVAISASIIVSKSYPGLPISERMKSMQMQVGVTSQPHSILNF